MIDGLQLALMRKISSQPDGTLQITDEGTQRIVDGLVAQGLVVSCGAISVHYRLTALGQRQLETQPAQRPVPRPSRVTMAGRNAPLIWGVPPRR